MRQVVRIDPDRAGSSAPIPQGGAVGIDMGIARFATLSDGTYYTPLNSFRRHISGLQVGEDVKISENTFSATVSTE
jgi:putative transposase